MVRPLPVTVTLNEVVAVFDDGSVAVHKTVVIAIGKSNGDVGVHVTVTVPELSDAEGAGHAMLAVALPVSVFRDMSDSGSIIGPSKSLPSMILTERK